MKALSVKNPHAHRIATGEKTLEIRSRATHHRGSLLICASARPVSPAGDWRHLPAGVMLCVVDLIDCRPMTPADAKAACIDFIPGHFAWVLSNVRPAKQVPIKGQLSLFNVPDELIEQADFFRDEIHGGGLPRAGGEKRPFHAEFRRIRLRSFQKHYRRGISQSRRKFEIARGTMADQRFDDERLLRHRQPIHQFATDQSSMRDVFADEAGGAGCIIACADRPVTGDQMGQGAVGGARAVCGLGEFGKRIIRKLFGREWIDGGAGVRVYGATGAGTGADRSGDGGNSGGRTYAAERTDRANDSTGGSTPPSGGDLSGGDAEKPAGAAEVNVPTGTDLINQLLDGGEKPKGKFYVRFKRADGREIEREFEHAGAAEMFVREMKLESEKPGSWVVDVEPVISTDPAELEALFSKSLSGGSLHLADGSVHKIIKGTIEPPQ